jgi:hypothetical protein
MKKIAQEFYKNQQEGKYINLEIDNNDKIFKILCKDCKEVHADDGQR